MALRQQVGLFQGEQSLAANRVLKWVTEEKSSVEQYKQVYPSCVLILANVDADNRLRGDILKIVEKNIEHIDENEKSELYGLLLQITRDENENERFCKKVKEVSARIAPMLSPASLLKVAAIIEEQPDDSKDVPGVFQQRERSESSLRSDGSNSALERMPRAIDSAFIKGSGSQLRGADQPTITLAPDKPSSRGKCCS